MRKPMAALPKSLLSFLYNVMTDVKTREDFHQNQALSMMSFGITDPGLQQAIIQLGRDETGTNAGNRQAWDPILAALGPELQAHKPVHGAPAHLERPDAADRTCPLLSYLYYSLYAPKLAGDGSHIDPALRALIQQLLGKGGTLQDWQPVLTALGNELHGDRNIFW
jgi:hypothetical protein